MDRDADGHGWADCSGRRGPAALVGQPRPSIRLSARLGTDRCDFITIIAIEAVMRSRRVHAGLALEMIQAALEQILPPLCAGLLLTMVLILSAPGSAWMLPGLWQVIFSLGGATSIDVTKHGIDKGCGIRKLPDVLHIPIDQMIFIGDAVFPGGNDFPAKEAGALTIDVRDPHETKRVIEAISACLQDK
jgi:hypothetical protein